MSRFRALGASLNLNSTMMDVVFKLKILGAVLEAKFKFDSHLRAIAVSIKLGIIKKFQCLFRDPILVSRYFWSFLLPVV